MLIECVPNISEAKDPQKVEKIANSVIRHGCKLLHIDPTPEINRTVVTFVGNKQEILNGAFELIKSASEEIDMRIHLSPHPRIGATDVCPFIPLNNATMDDCIQIARELGELVANELKIPAFMYQEATFIPERIKLADVRRGEFEGLSTRKDLPDFYHKSFGEDGFHKTAGAVIIGARKILIAYNITLSKGTDLKVAQEIAKEIREKKLHEANNYKFNNSLQYVRAIGWQHPNSKEIQVSINITDYTVTGMWRVFNKVQQLAKLLGSDIESSEVIGLVPSRALERVYWDSNHGSDAPFDLYSSNIIAEDIKNQIKYAIEKLKLRDFDTRKKILEENIIL